jgi:hypothetical protein
MHSRTPAPATAERFPLSEQRSRAVSKRLENRASPHPQLRSVHETAEDGIAGCGLSRRRPSCPRRFGNDTVSARWASERRSRKFVAVTVPIAGRRWGRNVRKTLGVLIHMVDTVRQCRRFWMSELRATPMALGCSRGRNYSRLYRPDLGGAGPTVGLSRGLACATKLLSRCEAFSCRSCQCGFGRVVRGVAVCRCDYSRGLPRHDRVCRTVSSSE